MCPERFPSLGIDTVKSASAVGDEYEAAIDGRGREDVLLERVEPNQAIGGDVAGAGGIDTFQPGFVFAPPDVTAAGHIDAVFVKDRHAIEVTRTFAPVGIVLVNIGLRRRGIEVELPYLSKIGVVE